MQEESSLIYSHIKKYTQLTLSTIFVLLYRITNVDSFESRPKGRLLGYPGPAGPPATWTRRDHAKNRTDGHLLVALVLTVVNVCLVTTSEKTGPTLLEKNL